MAENDFRDDLEEILSTIEHQPMPGATNPFAGAGDEVFHEHDTRVFFFDRLMSALGWRLGAGGDVAEEARIKSDTTKFVDYVGINAETRAPLLILEAKAWSSPFIAGRGKHRDRSPRELVVKAIEHLNAGGAKNASPVTLDWLDHLKQVAGYVQMFKEKYQHDVPRAALSSGRWLLIFKTPVETFCEKAVNDQQFCLMEIDDYVDRARTIFENMACAMLWDKVPVRIRASQLPNYITTANFEAAFHAILVRYEKTGAKLFAQSPRILVYPTVIMQRADGCLLTVIDTETPFVMAWSRTEQEERSIAPHLNEVAAAAQMLLKNCATALDTSIMPRDLRDFPGFPASTVLSRGGGSLGRPRKILVRNLTGAADNWLVVTGTSTHFLQRAPSVECRYHAWAACQSMQQAIGPNAVNTPSTDKPRSFFTDTTTHHCAHREVDDRRTDWCHIRPFDSRTCCKACTFHRRCWTDAEAASLPCGR